MALLAAAAIGLAFAPAASASCLPPRWIHLLERVHIVGDRIYAGHRPWRAWGFNWGAGGHESITEYFDHPTDSNLAILGCELAMASRLGVDAMRVPLELGQVMKTPSIARPRALMALRRLLRVAGEWGIYLDITGNLVWRPDRAPDWYDRLPERARWRAQAAFWRAVAHTAHNYPAVLCYELTSEPIISDKPGWYEGLFGGRWFIQIIAHPNGRSPRRLAREWTKLLKAAVRSQDNRPVTIGMLPETNGGFVPANVTDLLDMLVVHIYPRTGRAADAVELLKHYASFKKPVLLGETFPLWCDLPTEQAFLVYANPYLAGTLEFFNGRNPYHMTIRTISDAIYQAALIQFEGMRWILTSPIY